MPKAILCPYFSKHRPATKQSPERITCEGSVRRLLDEQMRRDVVYKFCALNYRECQIYQALEAYYERHRTRG